MLDCLLVAIAGNSLVENLHHIPDGQSGANDKQIDALVKFLHGGDGAHLPDLLARADVLQELWEKRDKTRFPQETPFAELAPLVGTTIEKDYRSLRVILLGRFSKLASAPAMTGTPSAIASFLHRVVKANSPALRGEVTVELRDLGVTPSNDADALPAVRAAVLDHCAQIEVDARNGERPQIVVNGVAGKNAAVDALMWAAGALSWKVAFTASGSAGWKNLPDPAASFALSPQQIAQQWTYSRALVVEARKTLRPDTDVGGRATDIKHFLRAAADEDLLPFVAVQSENGQPDWPRQSRMGNLLNAEQSTRGPRYYSASARLLERFAANPPEEATGAEVESAGAYANRLRELVKTWESNQLFGSNLVREMVLHEESHCQTVDLNVATMCEPLLDEGLLRPVDIFHLALAAWLHDWGHSGVVMSDHGAWRTIIDPADIRTIHGLLSHHRILHSGWQSTLLPTEKPWPAVISAHHQGWTSIGDDGPETPQCLKSVREARVKCLWDDWVDLWTAQPFQDDIGKLAAEANGPSSRQSLAKLVGEDHRVSPPDFLPSATRLQLLTCLFRVADAADIGLHRVPHRKPAVLAIRLSDEIGQYLEHHRGRIPDDALDDLRRYAQGELGLDHAKRERSELIRAACAGAADGPVAQETLEGCWDASWVDVGPLVAYVDHCLQQREFFEAHGLVAGVHLVMEPTNEPPEATTGIRWSLTAHVVPASVAKSADAVKRVLTDITREFGCQPIKSDGAWVRDTAAPRKQVVLEVFTRNGIRFDGAVEAGLEA